MPAVTNIAFPPQNPALRSSFWHSEVFRAVCAHRVLLLGAKQPSICSKKKLLKGCKNAGGGKKISAAEV